MITLSVDVEYCAAPFKTDGSDKVWRQRLNIGESELKHMIEGILVHKRQNTLRTSVRRVVMRSITL